METREVKQIKIWKLIMHAKDRDDWDLVAISANRQLVIDWYKKQQCNEYVEQVENLGDYTKYFKVGEPLEWYEPVVDIEAEAMDYEYGVSSEWINETEFPALKFFHSWLE
jgi:hypothetical protein